MKTIILLACVLSLIGLSGCQKEEREEEKAIPKVTIKGATWNVEMATTTAQRPQGLSGRSILYPRTGMLFVFTKPKVMDFWMQGCLVPIDIAFISADRKVVQTYTMQVEKDHLGRTYYNSQELAQYALEVPAGELAAAGVAVGDEVAFSDSSIDPIKAEVDP